MSEPQLVPVNAKFGDDFVTHLVLLTSADTMAEVAQKIAHHSVGKRVKPREAKMVVYYQGKAVPAEQTVTEAGIAPLQYVFVNYA